MGPGPKKTVSVVLPKEVYDQFNDRARAQNCPLSSYLRQVLCCYLEHDRKK